MPFYWFNDLSPTFSIGFCNITFPRAHVSSATNLLCVRCGVVLRRESVSICEGKRGNK